MTTVVGIELGRLGSSTDNFLDIHLQGKAIGGRFSEGSPECVF